MFLLALCGVPIVDLSAGNFTEYISSDKPTLIKFYAPWCGHCKNFAPKFVKLSETLESGKYQLAQVDCTVNGALCSQQGVRGYPTIQLYRSGQNIDEYDGNREPALIKNWLLMLGNKYE